MTEDELEEYIRNEKHSAKSVDEQVQITVAMLDEPIGPLHDGVKRADLEAYLGLNLEYNIGTSLSHLEEIGIVEEFLPPGPSGYAISERLDEIVNGRVGEVVEVDIDRLINHIQDDDPTSSDSDVAVADGGGTTVRSVVANAFDLGPESVEPFLRRGDQVEKLNTSIDAIEENEEVERRDGYGRIVFRNAAYRYRLTEWAIEVVER
jgi:hypothetical protein